MIFMSRKAISTARERIVCLEDVKNDNEAAKRLRELMAGGNYLDEDFEKESPDTRALVLPGDARTMNGDRVVVLLVKDRFDAACEDVAVVCKPLRSVRKNPEPRPRHDDRIGAMPKLPTLADLGAKHAHAPAAATVVAPPPAAELAAPAPKPFPPPPTNGKRRPPTKGPTHGMSRGAALLRNELLKRGITVKAAAVEFGCSAWQITRWQTGQQIPDVLQAAALERAAGIPMSSWSQSI